jgi:hypothetical protein
MKAPSMTPAHLLDEAAQALARAREEQLFARAAMRAALHRRNAAQLARGTTRQPKR